MHVQGGSPSREIRRQFFPIQNGWQFPKYPGKTLTRVEYEQ